MDNSWMLEQRSSSSIMTSKKGTVSRQSSSMEDVIGKQEEQITETKKRKVSWLSGSMDEVLSELEETASSPCQTPLAPSSINHDSSTSKKKRGPTKCLKTHGVRYEDRFPITLNVLGQPIGRYRATLSSYLGALARNAHLAPLTYTSWKGLKQNWKDMWETVISKFDIKEVVKKWVLQTICSSWRTYKWRLKKKYFKPNMMEGYNLKNRPPAVPLEQWKTLIKFWKSDQSELEDAMALHPEASEQSSRDDVLSQVLGKDRHGYVRTYGKGVVPSDLWGSRSQLQTQKVIDEVKRNAREEIRSIQEKMEEEMKVKLQEQVEAIKTEMLGGFKLILTQL